MFAGKTTRLIARLRAAADAGLRVVACKHRVDTRYHARRLETHDGHSHEAVAVAEADAILAHVQDADLVGIDEAHFFGRALIPVVAALRTERRSVVLAGIDHDAWGQPIPPLPELAADADEVELLCAPCHVCGARARFSQRMVPVTAGTMVGGPGEYEPRCALHFTPLPKPAPVYD